MSEIQLIELNTKKETLKNYFLPLNGFSSAILCVFVIVNLKYSDSAGKAAINTGHKVWEVLVIKGSTNAPVESDSIKGINS